MSPERDTLAVVHEAALWSRCAPGASCGVKTAGVITEGCNVQNPYFKAFFLNPAVNIQRGRRGKYKEQGLSKGLI